MNEENEKWAPLKIVRVCIYYALEDAQKAVWKWAHVLLLRFSFSECCAQRCDESDSSNDRCKKRSRRGQMQKQGMNGTYFDISDAFWIESVVDAMQCDVDVGNGVHQPHQDARLFHKHCRHDYVMPNTHNNLLCNSPSKRNHVFLRIFEPKREQTQTQHFPESDSSDFSHLISTIREQSTFGFIVHCHCFHYSIIERQLITIDADKYSFVGVWKSQHLFHSTSAIFTSRIYVYSTAMWQK